MTPLSTPLVNGQEPMTTADTFPDKPVAVPGEPVRVHMIAVHEWFTALSPERQEAFRQSVRDANNED